MKKFESNGLYSALSRNRGLVLMMVLVAGISIYAVADSRPIPVPQFVGVAEPVTSEQIEQIAAFDPFLPSKTLALAKAPVQVETSEVTLDGKEEGEIVIAATDLSKVALLLESSDSEQPQLQLAEVSPKGQNQSNPPPSNRSGNGKSGNWFGGKHGWILPTALIIGGATAITVPIAIHNSKKGGSKDPVLSL